MGLPPFLPESHLIAAYRWDLTYYQLFGTCCCDGADINTFSPQTWKKYIVKFWFMSIGIATYCMVIQLGSEPAGVPLEHDNIWPGRTHSSAACQGWEEKLSPRSRGVTVISTWTISSEADILETVFELQYQLIFAWWAAFRFVNGQPTKKFYWRMSRPNIGCSASFVPGIHMRLMPRSDFMASRHGWVFFHHESDTLGYCHKAISSSSHRSAFRPSWVIGSCRR